MKNRKRDFWKIVVVWAGTLLSIGVATASGQASSDGNDGKVKCKRVEASGTTVAVTTDCRSPLGLCATGLITGEELIRGTTFASVLGAAPSIGLPGIEEGTRLSLAGERTLTTSDGTLIFRFITVFDAARGEFAEIDRITGGTGKFAGATGTLWITGTGTTAFALEITGRVQVRKALVTALSRREPAASYRFTRFLVIRISISTEFVTGFSRTAAVEALTKPAHLHVPNRIGFRIEDDFYEQPLQARST